MNPINRAYERLVASGGVGITGEHWSQSVEDGRFRAVVSAGAVLCRFSGCTELAFTESRFGPVCERHAGAVTP